MNSDGQFIFAINRVGVEVYVLEDGKYVPHKVKCPESKALIYTSTYKMGKSEKEGVYTIIVEYNDYNNNYGYFSKHYISYFELDLKAFELTYVQTITI